MTSEGRLSLRAVLDELDGYYGPTPSPFPTDPFELILWENIAYLANDATKREALERLRETVGTRPDQIVRAEPEQLTAITEKGILADDFALKLKECARIALERFAGDLLTVVEEPAPEAIKALRAFPGVGEPGAEKILLYCRTHPSLAAESNGLRVLVRLGLCEDGLSYPATYAAARDLANAELGPDFDRMLRARFLLRAHGQELCRRNEPSCEACALRRGCPTGSA